MSPAHANHPIRIAILGSTGSIGRSALSVVDAHADRLTVVGLAAGANSTLLAEQVGRYRPQVLAMATGHALDAALQRFTFRPGQCLAGPDGLLAVATHPDVDVLLCASSGTAALEAVLAAIESGKTIALANKEVLVMAGGVVTSAAARKGVAILPVDSEHNAIHQCLHGRHANEVKRLILTASGGPFREHSAAELKKVGPEDALRHPTWRMGRKITIDSATLMNKGLEVIEAHWLFGVGADRIDVVIHPQSVVHSMVELTDGSIIAQLGVTDMRLPIQYAFSYPDRWSGALPSLDLVKAGTLAFAAPDVKRFPCLALAYRALRAPGSLAVVLNAANEVAVAAFLAGKLSFVSIADVIARAMDAHTPSAVSTLADVRGADRWAHEFAQEVVRSYNQEGGFPTVTSTLFSLAAFVFVLGVLVFVHELGHFLVARWLGVRVITFSIGFGPKLVRVVRNGIEYCVSAFPLGGYVKMAGENPDEARSGDPDEFLSRSKWDRFRILVAGPVMNIILAVALMWVVLAQGAQVPAFQDAPVDIGAVTKDSPAEQGGITPGDRITKVGSQPVATWEEFYMAVGARANRTVPVELLRDGRQIVVSVTPIGQTKMQIDDIGVLPHVHPSITTV